MEIENNDGNAVERQRDRNRRGERGSRFTDADGDDNIRDRSRDERGDKQVSKRVYVSNIPYGYRWQELKDLFRRLVGTVEFVEIFNNENNKSRGCGVVEFTDAADAEKAVEKMHRHEINGRQLVVRLDFEDRDKHSNNNNMSRSRDNNGGGGGGGGSASGGNIGGNDRRNMGGRGDLLDDIRYSSGGRDLNNFNKGEQNLNTYGLNASFLNNLGIQPPLHNKIFIANLDYKVDSNKLRHVFKLAGRVIDVDLSLDKDGKSRGFAVVEFDHPVEAVQAISMFDQQLLFDRRMKIRLDRIPDNEKQIDGLGGIGMGLGPFGEPLRNVAHNLPSLQNQNCVNNNSNLSNTPGPVSAPGGVAGSILGPVPNTNLSNLDALKSVMGNLNHLNPLLTTLGLGNLTNTNNSDSLNSGLDLGSKNYMGSGNGGNVGNSSGVSLGGSNAYNNLPQSNRLDSGLSNQYNSGLGNNSSAGNSGYSSQQRGSGDGGLNLFDLRGFNTQSDDYGRSSLQGYSSSQQLQNILKNGSGVNSNSGGRKISDTILIRNLPPSVTWQTLRDIFREIGEVKFAEMRGQDSGVVRFSKERDAELAIKLKDGSRFDGRTVEIGFF